MNETKHNKQGLIEASKLFREAMKKKNIDFNTFLKKSREIREQIADEWF